MLQKKWGFLLCLLCLVALTAGAQAVTCSVSPQNGGSLQLVGDVLQLRTDGDYTFSAQGTSTDYTFHTIQIFDTANRVALFFDSSCTLSGTPADPLSLEKTAIAGVPDFKAYIKLDVAGNITFRADKPNSAVVSLLGELTLCGSGTLTADNLSATSGHALLVSGQSLLMTEGVRLNVFTAANDTALYVPTSLMMSGTSSIRGRSLGTVIQLGSGSLTEDAAIAVRGENAGMVVPSSVLNVMDNASIDAQSTRGVGLLAAILQASTTEPISGKTEGTGAGAIGLMANSISAYHQTPLYATSLQSQAFQSASTFLAEQASLTIRSGAAGGEAHTLTRDLTSPPFFLSGSASLVSGALTEASIQARFEQGQDGVVALKDGPGPAGPGQAGTGGVGGTGGTGSTGKPAISAPPRTGDTFPWVGLSAAMLLLLGCCWALVRRLKGAS